MMCCLMAMALLTVSLLIAMLLMRRGFEKKVDRLVDELATEKMLRGVEASVSHLIYEKKLYAKDLEMAKLREALKASDHKRKELCKRLKEVNHVSD